MKKYSFWLLLVVIGFNLVACKKADPSEGAVEGEVLELPADAYEPEFENTEYGFKVQGPEGWVKKADSLGMLVTYVNPGNPQNFQENISLARQDKEDFTLADYGAATIAQIPEFFPEFELMSNTETTFKGLPALLIKYQIQTEGLTITAEQLIIEREQEFLIATYMGTPAVFDASYTKFEAMMESLVLVGA